MCPLVRSALTIENALLGFFYEKPGYGYEIYQELRRPTGLGLVWRIKQSHVYALLDRLERDGLLQGRVEVQLNRPAKKLFSLTDIGRREFSAWIIEPVHYAREMRLEFMAKSYFAQKAGQEQFQCLLQNQNEECENWLLSFKQREVTTPKQDLFSHQVIRYRIEQIKAILTWIHGYKTDGLPEQIHHEST